MNEKLQELGWEGKSSDEVNPDKNAPDFGFYVANMTGKQWLNTIGNLGTSVWENATLPENYWKEDEAGYKNSTIKTPAIFAGVSDGGIDLVSDYPQLVKLGYDVATKEDVRNGIWSSIKEISPSSVKTMASDAIKQKVENYNFSDKPYLGYHELGKDGVTVVSAIMGAGFLKAGDKALENATKTTGDKIKEAIEKKSKDLEKDMAEDWFKKRMSDAFDRYKKRISENLSDLELKDLQNAYEQRYKTLYKNREIGKITEQTFQELEGGAPKTFKLPNGDIRKVDNLIDNVAKEIKSGKLERNSFIEKQLEKDLELLTNKQFPINKIEWHCFGGASEEMKNVMKVLEERFGTDKFEFFDYTKF